MEQNMIRTTCKVPVKAVWETGYSQVSLPEGSLLHTITVNPLTSSIDVTYTYPADQEVSHELG